MSNYVICFQEFEGVLPFHTNAGETYKELSDFEQCKVIFDLDFWISFVHQVFCTVIVRDFFSIFFSAFRKISI